MNGKEDGFIFRSAVGLENESAAFMFFFIMSLMKDEL